MKKNINTIFLSYLLILIFFSIFFLFFKYQTGNDSTIAEWLINYEGGFTKRGLIGQISIIFARLSGLELRFIIYLLQIFSCFLYFICIFNFFKFYKFDRISLLALYSPIFILYPIAEIEVLARKEILVFILYFLYLFALQRNYLSYFLLSIYFIFAILIWEPIIFYLPIFIAIEIIQRKIEKINLEFAKVILCFVPGLLIGLIIALNPISAESYIIMQNVLKNEFGEACYGACSLLFSKSTISQQFSDNMPHYSIEVFLRYFLIILIGFGPLFILLKSSNLRNKKLFFFGIFDNLLFPLLLCLTPVLILFAMGYDWGRWVNITYVFTIIFYFCLSKNNYLEFKKKINNNIIFKLNKNTYIILFIIFCFSWNPKTVMTGDIGSFPAYRVPYKAVKTLINNF